MFCKEGQTLVIIESSKAVLNQLNQLNWFDKWIKYNFLLYYWYEIFINIFIYLYIKLKYEIIFKKNNSKSLESITF